MTIQSGFCNRNISVVCPQFNIFSHFLFPFISALKEVKKMVNCLKISSVSPPFCEIFFEEGWKSMLSLPPFLTLWILMEFAGSSDENILIIKVRTKREKRPRTWGKGFESLTIKMCTWDYKPLRLVLRCWCLTSMNHEVVSGDGRETFVTMIEGSLEFDLILLQLWSKIALSSRWHPSFKSRQVILYFVSLCSHIGYKAFKNVPASGLSCSYNNLRRILFSEVEVDFPSHSSQPSLAFLLSKLVVHSM